MGKIRHMKGELNKALQCFNKVWSNILALSKQYMLSRRCSLIQHKQTRSLWRRICIILSATIRKRSTSWYISTRFIPNWRLSITQWQRHTTSWGRNISATSTCKLPTSSTQKEITNKKVKLSIFCHYSSLFSSSRLIRTGRHRQLRAGSVDGVFNFCNSDGDRNVGDGDRHESSKPRRSAQWWFLVTHLPNKKKINNNSII